MNILLAVPNIEGRVGGPPINVAQLQSFINQRTSHRAVVADLTFHKRNWRDYLDRIIQQEAVDCIGLSVLSFEWRQAQSVAEHIKKKFRLPIIIGGVHAILKPEEVIFQPVVDMVCTGEGEFALKELLDNGLDAEGIQGIWYKKNGLVVRNAIRRLYEDIDNHPTPDFRDFDLERYFLLNNNHLNLMTTRGCPYDCSYCCNHALKERLPGKYVRFRSVEQAIADVGEVIEKYYDRGLRYIYFIDDIFILDKTWTLKFCEMYREQGYDKIVKWTANVRANLVNEEVISAMRKSGCYQVGMGIEAANDYIRNTVYKRNMTRTQIDDAIRIIRKSQMLLSIQFIIGAPFETIEMMAESLKMAKSIDADTVMFSILMPLPKTKIRQVCKEQKLIEEPIFQNSQVMYSAPVTRSNSVSSGQIKKFYQKIIKYQIVKYSMEGLKYHPARFLWDLMCFFIYLKPKYDLELQNLFKLTVKKYALEKIRQDEMI